MSNLKFSIIIPVYNAKKYIEDCVKSIIEQSYKNWELLLVNDGSTDGSETICNNLAKGDRRINVLHKMNGGPSSARNLGIKYVTGDYLLFVDADDLVQMHWLEEYYQCINKFNPDICFQNFASIPNDFHLVKKEKPVLHRNQHKLIKPSQLESAFERKWIIFTATWSKCFKTSIIKTNHIEFDISLSLQEDFLFTTEYICRSSIFALTEYKGYLYRKVEGSLSRKHIENKYLIIYKIIKYLDCLEMSTPKNKLLPCINIYLKNNIASPDFLELPQELQNYMLNKAKQNNLTIPYIYFIPFNLLIRIGSNVRLLKLFLNTVNIARKMKKIICRGI